MENYLRCLFEITNNEKLWALNIYIWTKLTSKSNFSIKIILVILFIINLILLKTFLILTFLLKHVPKNTTQRINN